jgi:hypothetical protein
VLYHVSLKECWYPEARSSGLLVVARGVSDDKSIPLMACLSCL